MQIIKVISLTVLVGLGGNALGAELDLETGEGALAAFRKIQCSLNDREPRTYWWHGRAYARVPGERDRLLFRVEGMNIRQCATVQDADRGTGFKLVTREILLYQDPKTGEVLDTWTNPWTGEEVEVLHVANDPVNSGPFFPQGQNGEPFPFFGTIKEGSWWITSTIPLFYTNALGGEFQEFVGGKYHATEMFNFLGEVDDLIDAEKPSADVRVGWVRMSQWLPWMKMGGRSGVIYMHTAGKKLDDYESMSETMKQQIADNYPDYSQPPPVNDDRPNETSWTYFKKILSERTMPQEEAH